MRLAMAARGRTFKSSRPTGERPTSALAPTRSDARRCPETPGGYARVARIPMLARVYTLRSGFAQVVERRVQPLLPLPLSPAAPPGARLHSLTPPPAFTATSIAPRGV